MLPEMSDCVSLIPPHHPGQLAPQLGERLQGHLVPAPERVYSQSDELHPLCHAAALLLPHLCGMAVSHGMTAVLGDQVHQGRLQSVDLGDVNISVRTARPKWEEDICGAFVHDVEETVWFLAGSEVSLLSCLVENVAKVAVPGDALAPYGAANGVVPIHFAHRPAARSH